MGRGLSTHLISVGFELSLGGRAHTFPAGRALGCLQRGHKVRIMTKDLGYDLAVSGALMPGGFPGSRGPGLAQAHLVTA